MKNWLTVAGVATLTLLTTGVFGPAHSEEAVQPYAQMNGFALCSAGPQSGGCQRFQGYIYVGRAADAAPKGGATDIPTLGDGRLYIHLGGADDR